MKLYLIIITSSFFLLLQAIPSTTAQAEQPADTLFNRTNDRGKKQGYWKKYDHNGKLLYRGYFVNGKPVGDFMRFYDDGSLKSRMYYHPKDDTVDIIFYYRNGTLAAKGQYFHRKKIGKWRYYSFYEGTLSYIEHYNNGLKDGLSIKFYASGDTAEILGFSNGIKEGIWSQFFPEGIPKLQATYVNNKLEGDFIIYSLNRKKQIAGFYKQNSRNGPWYLYNKDGKVIQIIHYKNGIAENAKELTKEQNALLDSLEKNKGKFKDPEEYGINSLRK